MDQPTVRVENFEVFLIFRVFRGWQNTKIKTRERLCLRMRDSDTP